MVLVSRPEESLLQRGKASVGISCDGLEPAGSWHEDAKFRPIDELGPEPTFGCAPVARNTAPLHPLTPIK